MKKIKLLTFLSALLCSFFIFNFNYKTSANNGENLHEVIDLVYGENFFTFGLQEISNNIFIQITVEDDIFIDYAFKDNMLDKIFLQLDNYVTGFSEPQMLSFSSLEIRYTVQLYGTIYIPKVYFNHYIYEVLGTTESDFYLRFNEYLEAGLDNYLKLYVRIPEKPEDSEPYRKYLIDSGSFDLRDATSPLTTLYRVVTNIETAFNLGDDVRLYFNQSTKYNLRTPLNRGYNSYDIVYLEQIDENKWQLAYDIAILNTMLTEYDYDVSYILFDLIDVFIKIIPSGEYYDGYDAGYSDGYSVGFNEGYDFGYDRGYDLGYDEGAIYGNPEAYDLGYKHGYNESFVATINKWLVPAIIIVMLLGGFFAITRKKRDGDI